MEKVIIVHFLICFQLEYLRYEQRLTGLLEGILQTTTLNDDERGNFFVMGGECNYLFRLNPKAKHLVYIDSESYQPPHVKKWSSDKVKVKELVDVAHVCIEETIKRLDVAERVTIIRKEKAVGIICNSGTGKLSREQLDEFALSIQQRLNNFQHVKSLRYHTYNFLRTSFLYLLSDIYIHFVF